MYIFKEVILLFYSEGDNINKKKLIKNIKIYGTILILSTSTFKLVDNNIYSYDNFNKTIESEHNINELDSYVLQGVCKVDEYYLVTAYNSIKDNYSKIYILDNNFNKVNEKKLDTTSHVGGITYDDRNKMIWITDNNGTISSYKKEDVLNEEQKIYKNRNIYVGDHLENISGQRSVAYIKYYDKKLYLGNYNWKNKSILKEYKIDEFGNIDHKYKIIKLPSFVQGVSFYEENDNKYLLISSSTGKILPSTLKIFEYLEDNDNYQENELIKYKTRPMMEELETNEDKLILVYESNAKIYESIINKSQNDIIKTNLNKLIKKL